jgi:hypothetical protein
LDHMAPVMVTLLRPELMADGQNVAVG